MYLFDCGAAVSPIKPPPIRIQTCYYNSHAISHLSHARVHVCMRACVRYRAHTCTESCSLNLKVLCADQLSRAADRLESHACTRCICETLCARSGPGTFKCPFPYAHTCARSFCRTYAGVHGTHTLYTHTRSAHVYTCTSASVHRNFDRDRVRAHTSGSWHTARRVFVGARATAAAAAAAAAHVRRDREWVSSALCMRATACECMRVCSACLCV